MNKKERARELFLQGYNCSQSVFCAFAADYGIEPELALRLSASFGGGIGRMRETCGALCGACMVIGLEKGQINPNDSAAKQDNYNAVQNISQRFKEMNGSTKCAELLKLRKNTPITSIPDERTAEYYKTRPCLRMVDSAVELLEDFLKEK